MIPHHVKRRWGPAIAALCGLTIAALLWAHLRTSPEQSRARQHCAVHGRCAQAALAYPAIPWDSLPLTGATLYVPRGSYAAERSTQYAGEVSAAIALSLRMLGEAAHQPHLRVFVFGSREEVEAVSGDGSNGWADPLGNNASVVARWECRPVFRHEVMHVVSLRLWGHPLAPEGDPRDPADGATITLGGWLREGLAAAAEQVYGRYTYRGMAAQWEAEGALLPLDTLVNAFYRQDDLAAYLQSGSLVQYLLETYGAKPLKLVWRVGAPALTRAYGKAQPQIEQDWHAWLRRTPTSERPASIALARAEDKCPKRRR